MATPMDDLEKKLSAGQQPTYDDLEATLAQCLNERNLFEKTTVEMTGWLSRIVHAHLANDNVGVKNILEQFISQRVKFVPATNNNVH